MNPIAKNILAVIAGAIFGGLINMGIIEISIYIIPPPEGADVTTTEGLKASMHLFKPINFLMPFLAHAIGTFAGAWLTAFLAASRKMMLAMLIGVLFLIGGIAGVAMLPSPMWFNITDLVGAYLPFSYVGGKLGSRGRRMKTA